MLRWRLIFGIGGAVACLIASFSADQIYQYFHLSSSITDPQTPALIYRSEIGRRVQLAGGQTGDIQISLAWNNRNDLDLWCVEPYHTRVWFMHKHSLTGGRLDVDANASIMDLSSSPVENIYWPYGYAPKGRYSVYVNYYANHGDPDPTHYQCRIVAGSFVHQYSGEISPRQRILVTSFNFVPGFNSIQQSVWHSLILPFLITGSWIIFQTVLLSLTFCALLVSFKKYFNNSIPITIQYAYHYILYAAAWAGIGVIIAQSFYSFINWLAQLVSTSHPGIPIGYMPFILGFSRCIGWVLLFAVTSRGVAAKMPYLPDRTSIPAGIMAGLIGALLFLYLPVFVGDPTRRMLAALIWGFLIGFLFCFTVDELQPGNESTLSPGNPFTTPQILSSAGILRPQGRIQGGKSQVR